MLLIEGQLNDHVGTRLLYRSMPKTKVLIAGKGYDSNELRRVLKNRGIETYNPQSRNRKVLDPYDRKLYKTRHKIENLVPNSRISEVRQRIMIDACTLSSQQSELQQLWFSISINGS